MHARIRHTPWFSPWRHDSLVMEHTKKKTVRASRTPRDLILIGAQVLVLLALALGLQFVLKTTGGTLFVFASIAPLLVAVSIAAVAAVAIHIFRRSHSLFNLAAFEAGQIIFRKGDIGDCAYFIQDGEVEVLDEGEAGIQSVIATLSTGQYFGEMSLLSDAPRSATLRARTTTKLSVIGKSNFLMMLNVIHNVREDVSKTIEERSIKLASSRARGSSS